jgi:hypothetical protein
VYVVDKGGAAALATPVAQKPVLAPFVRQLSVKEQAPVTAQELAEFAIGTTLHCAITT